LVVRGADTLTGEQIEVEADLVVLAAAAVPRDGAKELAKMLNIPHDAYGFFTEAHPKLQPVESVTKGIYLAGACQFPKDVPDSVATAGAASIKACSILSQDELTIDPKIAYVETDICSGCLDCLKVCPFDAIEAEVVNGREVASIVQSLCHGCGNCASTCRTKAANVRGFSDDQIYAQISAPFSAVEEKKVEGSK
jgi:heterodisulfide reductase subunit A